MSAMQDQLESEALTEAQLPTRLRVWVMLLAKHALEWQIQDTGSEDWEVLEPAWTRRRNILSHIVLAIARGTEAKCRTQMRPKGRRQFASLLHRKSSETQEEKQQVTA